MWMKVDHYIMSGKRKLASETAKLSRGSLLVQCLHTEEDCDVFATSEARKRSIVNHVHQYGEHEE